MEATQHNESPFIEIGSRPYLKHAFPNETAFFSTVANSEFHDPESNRYVVSIRTLPLLWNSLRSPDTKLIVCEPTFFSPWHWRWVTRALFNRKIFKGNVPLIPPWGPQLLRGGIRAPIAVLDLEDTPFINRNNFYLWDQCAAYFKRELPTDHWRLFMKTGHANLPTPRFRSKKRNLARISKLRPISLGLPLNFVERPERRSNEKASDIFFAGRVAGSSTVREQGLPELIGLRNEGIVVDIPDGPLPREEFHDRMSRARLTWSPEGYGWDCFRHYESLACGSVPVMNHPSIQTFNPLIDGQHGFYYGLEPGGLSTVVHRALSDHQRLKKIARDGYAHMMQHHTVENLSRYIVKTILGADW